MIDKIIKERKSIRKYKSDKISNKFMAEILEAGRLAPSAKNTQNWKYYVVSNENIINEFKEKSVFVQDFVYGAPRIVICAVNPKEYMGIKNYIAPDKIKDSLAYSINDLGISTSFMILRAKELGIDSCYVGLLDRDKIREILSIPKDYVIMYAITFGFADENGIRTKRKEVSSFVEFF